MWRAAVCGPPSNAEAYIFNATVVPPGRMPYLTLWPDGEGQPTVSTLNAFDGFITSNMAIVPTNEWLHRRLRPGSDATDPGHLRLLRAVAISASCDLTDASPCSPFIERKRPASSPAPASAGDAVGVYQSELESRGNGIPRAGMR